MATKFNPSDYIIKLQGKDYLQVAHRIMWFRHEHPAGIIAPEVVSIEPLIMKATIMTEGGTILAVGHGSANNSKGTKWTGREIEKAETAAIGRALAHAGYGTQFTGQDDDDDYLADSPMISNAPKIAPKGSAKPNGAWLKDEQQLDILKARGEALRLEWIGEDIDRAKTAIFPQQYNTADEYADAIISWLELNIMPD